MKVKNASLLNVLNALDELVNVEVKASLAFKIKMLYEKVARQYDIYLKMKGELLEKAAQRNEDGSMKQVEGTQNVYIKEEYIEEIKELEDADGDEFTPINLSELVRSNCDVKAATLFRLGELLQDDTDK